jgi:hypothetical protein
MDTAGGVARRHVTPIVVKRTVWAIALVKNDPQGVRKLEPTL